MITLAFLVQMGFSFSRSVNQEIRHRKTTFRNEYYELLKKFEIPFEEKYLFEFLD